MKRVCIPSFVAIFIIALLLNALWELIQMPLYIVDVSMRDYWMFCLRASVWDAVIITGIYYLIDTPHRKTRYTLSVIACLLVAIFIEHRALTEGRWAYNHLMPTMFNIGIVPLVQLPLLAITTYEITSRRKSIL